MQVHQIDPLKDERWTKFVDSHPSGSVFHTAGWLTALTRTYGYKASAYVTTDSDRTLTGALVVCAVKSWLTGSRLVSLPFSDHCQPMVNSDDHLCAILAALGNAVDHQKQRYVELRPLDTDQSRLAAQTFLRKSQAFTYHSLDLRPKAEELFAKFHKNGIQKMIERAKRERLEYEQGRSQELLANFYRLLLVTRRKHGLPAQPLAWFHNLIDAFGENLSIHLASKNGIPVASILTLRHGNTLVYKYGCSDSAFNNLGGTPFLLWNAIQQAKESGAEHCDLGRSDLENEGLITFKNRWGATRYDLSYYRYPMQPAQPAEARWKGRFLRRVVEQLPTSVVTVAGNLLYKHIA